MELSCESNVFFLYAHTMEEAGFKELQVGVGWGLVGGCR